jgi:hypothetical protein
MRYRKTHRTMTSRLRQRAHWGLIGVLTLLGMACSWGGTVGTGDVAADEPSLGGSVIGMKPRTAVCTNLTTGQQVTLKNPGSAWDCEAAGLDVAPDKDRVLLLVRGPVRQGAMDVGGAVTGMAPTSGGCSNLTTGQQVTFQHMQGATEASCVAAGLVVRSGDLVQIRARGVAE